MEENKNNNKRKLIRNSTAEFLMFQLDNKEQGIEVFCFLKALMRMLDYISKKATTEYFSVV